MKGIIIAIFVCIVGWSALYAQIAEGGTPISFSLAELKSINEVYSYNLSKVAIQQELDEDKNKNINNRYAVYENITLDIKKKGTLSLTPDGKIWRVKIEAKNAFSISLIFSHYKVPHSANLFVYSLDKKIIRGAYTIKNNKESGLFALADFPGESVIIEYYEPNNVEFAGSLIIGMVGKAYRDLGEIIFKETTDENINITCPQGYPYQTEKHSVAKMTFQDGNSGYLCTGALINNTRNDGTPFFLTANHCLSTETVANTLITYFNYERINCNGSFRQQQTLSGSVLKATNTRTDFTLLLLSEEPTNDYRPYYAGWNAESDDFLISGYGIHHPQGDLKKIAISQDSIRTWEYTISWQGNTESAPNTHWLVFFNEGFTEGGSSGSPLFDNNSRIIGQLHGGGEADFYGKLSQSWNEGSLAKGKLKPHLDPDNTGALIFNGYYSDEVIPEAYFITDFTSVCEDASVILRDGSAFNISDYKWKFSPNSVQFLDGTSDTSKKPVVAFEEAIDYTITLKVSNTYGSDSITRNNYISSGTELKSEIKYAQDTIACYSSFEELKFYGAGADSFNFEIINGEEFVDHTFSANGDTIKLLRKNGVQLASTVYIVIQLKGMHGNCSDSIVQRVSLIVPDNDYVANALALNIGENGPFDNYCASPEENEPHPTIGDCATLGEWCDCEVGGPYVDNSVWFTFIGPESGIIGIDCPGFDNQIAVYDAGSAEDIISGNPALYTIIGAIDDYYDEEGDFAARINSIDVTPGKEYWLQVDGSACGAYGLFSVRLIDGGIVSSKLVLDEDSFVVYPNPASTSFTIKGVLNQTNTIKLISMEGKIIALYVLEPNVNGDLVDHTLQLPGSISSGLYFIEISDGKSITNKKLSVVR